MIVDVYASNYITTRVCEITFENDYLFLKFLPECEVTFEDAVEIIAAGKKLTHNGLIKILIDGRGIKSISNKAQKVFANKDLINYVKAQAMVYESLATKMLANIYLQWANPPYPTRMFNSAEKAIEWLNQYK